MRIIGGEFKSRRIVFPKSRLTRPMTDRGKETIFNILSGLLSNKWILDLYAGSGSLGLEALSRGAQHVTFVDRAPWAVRAIQKNLKSLGLEHRARVLQADALRVIDKLAREGQLFSLVFVDPPFHQGLVKKTLIKLDRSVILTPFTSVVVGHSRLEELPASLQTLRLTRTKRIGQACLSFLFRIGNEHGETKSYLSGEL